MKKHSFNVKVNNEESVTPNQSPYLYPNNLTPLLKVIYEIVFIFYLTMKFYNVLFNNL